MLRERVHGELRQLAGHIVQVRMTDIRLVLT
jgi:hypothetical protein